ncbi:hypothetical protein LCGC14_1076960, partial [marine sediment metagenome]
MKEKRRTAERVPQPVTTILIDSPWIRMTYLFPDEATERLGFGTVVLSCFKCGSAQLVSYQTPVPLAQTEQVYGDHGDPIARNVRDLYEQG